MEKIQGGKPNIGFLPLTLASIKGLWIPTQSYTFPQTQISDTSSQVYQWQCYAYLWFGGCQGTQPRVALPATTPYPPPHPITHCSSIIVQIWDPTCALPLEGETYYKSSYVTIKVMIKETITHFQKSKDFVNRIHIGIWLMLKIIFENLHQIHLYIHIL
jgi:hypothetical protein